MIPLPDAFLSRPIAHRALHDVAHGRPENSRAAIRAAIAHGYGIEIDLQLSRDGQAMVFHDYDLSRLTGAEGQVSELDASALHSIALTGGDEGIPGLPEVLELVDGQVPLLIELKDQHGAMGRTDGRLEEAVARDLKDYGGEAALMSFNPNMVVTLSKLVPDRPRGFVTCGYAAAHWPELPEVVRAGLRAIPDFERAGCSFISHHAADLTRPRVKALWAQGIAVLTWTIRSPEEEAAARQHADNVTFEGYLAEHPG